MQLCKKYLPDTDISLIGKKYYYKAEKSKVNTCKRKIYRKALVNIYALKVDSVTKLPCKLKTYCLQVL